MILLGVLLAAVVAVSLLYPRVLSDAVSFAMMVPVMGYALWFFVPWDWLSPQTFAITTGAALVAGVLLFVSGLPLSAPNPRAYLQRSIAGLPRFLAARENWPDIAYQVGLITYEELIWRVFLIGALSVWLPVWAVIPIAAALFWYVHEDNRSLSGHSLEFFLFALVLASIYALLGSLLAVWLIHAIRNLMILSAVTEPR